MTRSRFWWSRNPSSYAYYVDETADEMIAGNEALALVYSGEAATAMESNRRFSPHGSEGGIQPLDRFLVHSG